MRTSTPACFLAPGVDHAVGQVFELSGPEGHHAAAVRRVRVGEQVYVADGAGEAVLAEVVSVGKNQVGLRVLEALHTQEQAHRWVAVQGLAKGERSDIAIEALTELGVDELCAWQASRSVVRWDVKADKGLARWATKVAEATKQSRRFRVPQVGYLNTAEVVARLRGAALGLVLHESATTPLSAIDLPESGEIVFVIGPEGGITPEELAAFAEVGALPVSISDAVLRTSTAGVVALAQLQALTAASLRGTK